MPPLTGTLHKGTDVVLFIPQCNLSLVDSLEKVLNLTKGRMKDGEILVIVTFLRDFVSANMSNYIDQSRLNTTIQVRYQTIATIRFKICSFSMFHRRTCNRTRVQFELDTMPQLLKCDLVPPGACKYLLPWYL